MLHTQKRGLRSKKTRTKQKEKLFQRLVRQDVPADARGQRQQQQLQPYLRKQKDYAVEDGEPRQAYGDDFGMKRYGLMFAEIADVRAQPLLS